MGSVSRGINMGRRLVVLAGMGLLCASWVGCVKPRPARPERLATKAIRPAAYSNRTSLARVCLEPGQPLHLRMASAKERAQSYQHHIEGVALLEQGLADEAAFHFVAAYELEPRAKLLYLLGRAYERQGRYDYAIGAYDAYVRSDWRDARSCQLAVAAIEEIQRILVP